MAGRYLGKKGIFVFFIILLVSMAGNEAVRAQGVFGGTDLVTLPTSSVLPPGGYSIGAHYWQDDDYDWTKVQFDLGLIKNLQIGAVTDFRAAGETTAVLKYRLAPERIGSFGLAAVLEDIGKKEETAYMVASQTLPQYGIRWHLGVEAGAVEGFFIGVNKVFNSIKVMEGHNYRWPRVILIGEYSAAGLNLGTRVDLSGGLFFDLAAFDFKDYTLGIAYNKYL